MKKPMAKRHKFLIFGLIFLGIWALAPVIPAFLRLVEFLGYRIPQNHIRLDYIKGVAWALFLGVTILIWPVRAQDKKALLLIWAIKCFVMLFFMLFYEYHYGLDAFGYFATAGHGINEWKSLYVSQAQAPVVFIGWLQVHCFFDSYHAMKVTFGMIGLVAIYIFYRAVVMFMDRERIAALYIFALFPSIMFWSSTIGKEPILLLGIAAYCFEFIKWQKTRILLYLVIMLLIIASVAYIRVWMGIILTFPILVISIIFPVKSIRANITAISLLTAALIFFGYCAADFFHIKSSKKTFQVVNSMKGAFSRGESAVNYKDAGMFTALFRPLPGEVDNVFGILAGLEDAFLLILSAIALKRMRWRELSDPVVIWAVLLIAIWAAAYGFVSYNLGTVCRYRLQILPVFLGLLLYFSRDRAISR